MSGATPDASRSAWACRRRAARLRCQLDGLAERLALFPLGAQALLMSSGVYMAPTGMTWHCLTLTDTCSGNPWLDFKLRC